MYLFFSLEKSKLRTCSGAVILKDLGTDKENDRNFKANLSSSIFVISASKWKTSQQPDNTGLSLVKVDDGENGYRDKVDIFFFGVARSA